jgi:ribonuclease Z
MDLDVLFVGTAASAPTVRRGLPATLVRRGGEKLLVDCGEGTQRQLVRSVGLVEIDAVLITHFHADHVLGLPGMLKTYGLGARERPLRILGPRGLERLLEVLAPVIGRLPFELEVQELESGAELQRDGYVLAAFAVDHGVTALGYALVEHERPGRFDEDRARELGVAPGPDFGRLQRGESVNGVDPEQVLGDARRGRKLVLTGDTAPCEMTRAVAFRADLLVHEATFAEEDTARARATGHSTARAAAELAAAAEVELLALTHVSARYPAGLLRDEARGAFERTVVPRDFDRIEIPLPERGRPAHVRAEENAQATAPGQSG